MSICHWKVNVFQHSRDDSVVVDCDKHFKVSGSLIGLILFGMLIVFRSATYMLML